MNHLLLLSGNKHLEDWLLTFLLLWIPQLLWIIFAFLVLFGIMSWLRNSWARWIFMWIPYFLIGALIFDALRVNHWDYTRDNPFVIIANNPTLWENWAPAFISLPFLILCHFFLLKKQTQRKEHNQSISPKQ